MFVNKVVLQLESLVWIQCVSSVYLLTTKIKLHIQQNPRAFESFIEELFYFFSVYRFILFL